MDPYSAEGELINIHNHFHQGQYQEVIDFDTSSFSAENALPARVLALRSQIALGNVQDVLADVKGESEPELQVLGALAQFTLGKVDAAVQTVEKVASSAGDNATVQVIGGTVLQNAGKSEEALALLSQHSGSRTYKDNLYALDICANECYSRCRLPDCSDPTPTEPNRSRSQGSPSRSTMGPRQPFGEPCRVMGWIESGKEYWCSSV